MSPIYPIRRLAEVSHLITKGTTPTTLGFDFTDCGIPFVRAQSIQDGSVDPTADPLFISEETHRVLARSQIAPDDVLISIAGTIGRVGIVPIGSPAMNCNQAVAIVRPTPEIYGRYLMRWLSSQDALRQIGQSQVTATISNLSLGQIAAMHLPLPPLAEQLRIAAILDAADALRQQRRQALRLLDQLSQSIFLDMFGDPATNPKGWPLLKLGSCFSEGPIFGSMLPPTVQRKRWLSLRVANIQNWKLDLSDRKYVDLDVDGLRRHTLRDGDLIMARAIASEAHLGKCVIVQPGSEQWAFDSHVMRLRLKREIMKPEFLASMLQTKGGRSRFLKATRKTTVQYNINTKEIAALQMPVPPIEAQERFQGVSLFHQNAVTTNVSTATHLDTLFAALQHRAFRGEL
jgi:type I restriction enzyme, S subunit